MDWRHPRMEVIDEPIAVGCCLGLALAAWLRSPPMPRAASGGAAAVRRRHIVTLSLRNDLVADAPPFLVIARKYGSDTEALVFNPVDRTPR